MSKRIEELEKNMEQIFTRLTRLECKHVISHREFTKNRFGDRFYQVCGICGEYLEVYEQKVECDKAKIMWCEQMKEYMEKME